MWSSPAERRWGLQPGSSARISGRALEPGFLHWFSGLVPSVDSYRCEAGSPGTMISARERWVWVRRLLS